MHRCFQILDTYMLILRCLQEDPDGLASLAVMARTCRALSEPALDVLWEKLGSFADLVRCFPRETWDGQSYYWSGHAIVVDRIRPLIPSDWSRFSYHAPRVKYLTLKMGRNDWVDPKTYEALLKYRLSFFLFPRLCRLEVWDFEADYWQHLQPFLGPSLEEFSLICRKLIPTPSAQSMTSLLANTAHHAPNLTSLTIEHAGHYQTASIPCVLGGLRSLRRLHLDVPMATQPSADFVNWLMRIPFLSSLRLQVAPLTIDLSQGETASDVQMHAIAPGCKTLEVLKLTAASIPTVTTVFALLSPLPYLRELSIGVDVAVCIHDLKQIRRLIGAIVHQCSPEHLERLKVVYPTRSAAFVVGIEEIASLLVFRNLRHFILYPGVPVDLNDTELKRLVDAWPHLRTLRLGSPDTLKLTDHRRRLTVNTLETLVTRCPRLQDLEICLDVESITA
ncbi:hypothetical protein CERSUDRAFT_114336, partial [Gelatoporia subvermispora B]